MKFIYKTARLTFVALLLFSVVIFGQTPTPANGAAGVAQTTANLSWTTFGSGTFDVEFYGTDGTYTTVVTSATATTALTFAHGQTLAYNTTYYWRLRDNSGPGAWNNYSFKTEIDPNSITINSEPTGTSVAVTGQSLTWSYSSSGGYASTVKIEVQLDDGGGWVTQGSATTGQGSAASNITVNFATLKENTAYSVQVLVTNEDNTGNTFTKAGTGFTTANFPSSFVPAPPDGATGVTLTPVFAFATSTAADSYTLEVNTNNTFSGTTIYNGSPGTSGSFTLSSPASPLQDNTTYYWRFTYNNSASGNTQQFGPYSFSTEQQTTTTPANGATGVSISGGNVAFSFTGATGADQYQIRFGTSSGSYTQTSGWNSSTSANVSYSWLYNTTYYYVIDARNNAAQRNGEVGDPIQTSAEASFTTEIATPVITAPTASATGQALNPTITWTFAGGTAGVTFKIQYRTNGGSTWTDGTTGIAGTATSSPLGATLLYNTAYDVRVVAMKSGESDKPSAAVKFTTLLDTPTLSTPSSGTTVSSLSPSFTWGMNANYSNVKFELLLDTSSPASTVNNNVTGALTMSTASALTSATKYYYKIKATVNDAGADNNGETTTSATENYFYTPLVLNSPANGLTGVAIEPTFTWTDATFESSYKLLISTAGSSQSAFDAAVVRTKTGIAANTTSYTFSESDTSLSNNSTYYWQVIAVDGSNTVKSPIWMFKTWPNMTITHGWPTSSATVYTTNTTFSWAINTSTGSLKFKPQVVASTTTPTTAGWAAATLTTTTTSLNTSFSLTGGTQYYWRVIVLNSSNEVVAYSTPTTFTTSGGTNVTLYPSWPTGGNTVYTTTPTAYWYLDVYATGLTYQIRYATNNSVDGNGMLNHSSATSYPTSSGSFSSNQYITFPTLTAGTTYYWQVRAYYATTTSYSDWSSVSSFTVNNTNAVVVPTPSYPTGGVTVYTSSPTLYWYLGTNATGLTYEIDYALQSTGVDGTADATGISTLYKQITGLTPGATYEWRVRSNYGSTNSSWSSTQTFVVDGGVSSASVVASWPTGNPTVYTTKPTLSWYLNGSSAGITGYKVKYSTSSETWSSFSGGSPSGTKGEIDITGATNTTTTLTVDLTYGQKYYWAVAATDGSTFTSYSEGSFTIVGGSTAGSPILSSPIGGITVYTKSPTLYWYMNGSTTGIQGYEVKYSKSGFLSDSTTVTSALSSTSTSVALSGLTPGATYSWKVRAFYGGSTYGSYSSVATFVVDPGASPVQPLIGGPNNVTITSSSPVASWVLPVQSESQLSYELVYSKSEDMSDAQTISGLAQPFAPISGLEAGQTYYWKVRSVTNNGVYSDYSPRASFSTDQTTAVEEEMVIPDKFTVDQNYPNPFNPSTVIRFGIPEGQFVTVKIYNMLGQEVRTLISGNMNAGTYELQWNGVDNSGQTVTSGAYIFRVVAGNNAVTKKMMLLK